MAEVTTAELDRMIAKIQKLLARADHPNTPVPEADACRAKAEKYMAEYRIAEQDMVITGHSQIIPVNREVPVCDAGSPFASVYRTLMSYVTFHCGLDGVFKHGYDDEGNFTQIIHLFGYDIDLRYAEVLYQNARMIFADRLEPKYDPNLSDQDNVYRMRAAGMERIRVSEAMGWTKGGAKVTRLYKLACEERGEDPLLVGRGTDSKTYREQYAQGFRDEFWQRLVRAKDAVDVKSGELVLANRRENVQEAFWKAYPQFRPSDAPDTVKPKVRTRAKKWTKADEAKWLKAQSATAQAARGAGARAASEVSIDGVKRKEHLS